MKKYGFETMVYYRVNLPVKTMVLKPLLFIGIFEEALKVRGSRGRTGEGLEGQGGLRRAAWGLP